MSLGYAEKLSYREDVGTVGMSEIFDPHNVLEEKIAELAMLIRKSKHLVAFTGAGISTSCGIPDFRGPKGVWTLQREGKGVPEASLPFHRAMPSLTHMALVELERAGILKFVISQNVDSLHLRSGIPREKLAELHGNSFREVCPSCGAEYHRDFEVETIGMKETSRRCSDSKCNARLKDTVLDWEDALPPKEMDPASEQCRKADVVLCLGTSLQITPACNLPLKSIRGGGKIVIVNLQLHRRIGSDACQSDFFIIQNSVHCYFAQPESYIFTDSTSLCCFLHRSTDADHKPTPKDKKASLVIHGLVDKVIAGVMYFLNLRIPPYVRIDFVRISFSHTPKKETYIKWVLRIQSIHGPRAPLPFLQSIEVSFPDRPDWKAALLPKRPFRLVRETSRKKSFKVVLKFNLSDGCGCSHTKIEWPVNFWVKKQNIVHDKNEVICELRDAAERESSCGMSSIMEKMILPKSEATINAIVTNTKIYNYSVEENRVHEIASNSNAEVIKRSNELENGGEMPSKRSKWSWSNELSMAL